MNILIIGSEGSLGKSLKNYFVKIKSVNTIYCIDKIEPSKTYKKVIFKRIDLSKNYKSIYLIKKKIDIALILSFNLNFKEINKRKYFADGKKILRNCLKIVKKNEISKVIYFSSFAVYGFNKKVNYENSKLNPINIYGKLKVNCEKEIIKNAKGNFKYLILRISQIYGETIKSNIIYKFIKLSSENKYITLHGKGNQKRDFLNIRDFLRLINVIKNFKISNIYNVCGDQKFKIIEIIKILKLKYKIVENFDNLLRLDGSNKKIKKDFKWKPIVDLKQEIKIIKKKIR